MKDVISIRDFSRQDIDSLIDEALKLKQNSISDSLDKYSIASLFFENSTRTRISSETASSNLGAYVNGFSDSEGTSIIKGESLSDTVRMFESYEYDAIIMRHSLEGAARAATKYVNIPIINAGDGSNGHPTQTLLDLMTIKEKFGHIDGLKIAMVGDLKYGRTVHSLLHAFESYSVEPWFVSPKNLAMPSWRIEDYLLNENESPVITSNLLDAINEVDIIYMTRVQRERFPDGLEGEMEYKKVSKLYNLTSRMLKDAKKDLIILHPLPRYKHNLEIGMDVDNSNHAKYFQQVKNGVYMREAILLKIFGEGFCDPKSNYFVNPEIWKDLDISNGSKKGNNLLYRLDNGTLIDHIENGKGDKVMKVLDLEEYTETPLIYAKNISSKKLGSKDIIGIHNKELSKYELSKLALVADPTINIIKNKHVVKKGKVVLPSVIEELIQCQNPKCISNPDHDEHISSLFHIESIAPLRLRCDYCEKSINKEEIKF